MKLVTFNPFRTIGIPNLRYIKPDNMFKDINIIKEADFLLFPEKWQINSLVYGLKKNIFPSIESIHLGFDKVEMTRALWSVCPTHVPYTEILGSSKENLERVLMTFPFPFVAKEIRNSMGNGVFLIENSEQFYEYANRNTVLYVQEFLEIDRDLRICVIGDEVIASYWRIGENQFHNNVSKGGKVSYLDIPAPAIELVKTVAKQLNINHAGFDLVFANNQFYFLEFNILFGNQALTQMGISPEQKIYEYLLKQIQPPFPTSPDKNHQLIS
jgi:ribosomal protein S6--L-glutamate ligase